MKAVNKITEFFVKKFREVEEVMRRKKKHVLADAWAASKEAAKAGGADEEEADAVAHQAATLAVMINTATLLKNTLDAVARAGRIICQVGAPDQTAQAIEQAALEGFAEAAELGRKLQTPEGLREEAGKVGADLLVALKVLQELLPACVHMSDDEHVAEMLIQDGPSKSIPADPTPKARPVSGDVLPFNKRWTPSDN